MVNYMLSRNISVQVTLLTWLLATRLSKHLKFSAPDHWRHLFRQLVDHAREIDSQQSDDDNLEDFIDFHDMDNDYPYDVHEYNS